MIFFELFDFQYSLNLMLVKFMYFLMNIYRSMTHILDGEELAFLV